VGVRVQVALGVYYVPGLVPLRPEYEVAGYNSSPPTVGAFFSNDLNGSLAPGCLCLSGGLLKFVKAPRNQRRNHSGAIKEREVSLAQSVLQIL
jgi:hypothetical protein